MSGCPARYQPPLNAGPVSNTRWPGGVYGGGSAPMIVVSRLGPRHATDATPSNHYSMLLTIEEGFGLGKLGYTSDSAQVLGVTEGVVKVRLHRARHALRRLLASRFGEGS